MRKFYLAFITLAFITTLSLDAQWSSNSAVNTVVCNETHTQNWFQIASTSDGGSIVVWTDNRNGNDDIYGQKFNSSGAEQWTANGIPICNASNQQTVPKLISDGSGGAIIIWEDMRNGSDYDMYAQRVNSSGVAQWTSNGKVISAASNHQANPNIVSDGAGGAIIVWVDFRNGNNNQDIYGKRINSDGSTNWGGTDGIAFTSQSGNQDQIEIVSDGGNGAVISFRSDFSGNYDIYVQKVNSNGSIQWGTDGVDICAATNNQQNHKIISDGFTGYFITWEDRRTDSNGDIYAQRINSSGSPQWTTDGIAIASNQTYAEAIPVIIGDGSLGAIIVWNSNVNNWDIYAKRINSDGSTNWGGTHGIAIENTFGNEQSPQIISDGSNGVIITYYGNPVATYDIYTQKINSSGSKQWTSNGVIICNASTNQVGPYIVADGAGGGVMIWDDPRNGNNDIYIQNVKSDGTIGPASAPTISTTVVSSITNVTATSGGNVTSDGGASVTVRGVIYGKSSNPELSASSTTTSDGTGTGSFASSLTNLTLQTLYYVKAYATNSGGTGYGSQVSFTTIPTMPAWGLIAFGVILATLGGMYIWKNNI